MLRVVQFEQLYPIIHSEAQREYPYLFQERKAQKINVLNSFECSGSFSLSALLFHFLQGQGNRATNFIGFSAETSRFSPHRISIPKLPHRRQNNKAIFPSQASWTAEWGRKNPLGETSLKSLRLLFRERRDNIPREISNIP